MNDIVITMSQADSSFLAAVLDWGINLIKIVQSIQSPFLTAFMKGISFIGTEYFYIFFGLFIFWCWNEKRAFPLGLLIIVSGWVNSFFKVLFNLPRPFEFEPGLGLAFESTRAFPSGHAQNSMTFWIAAAFFLTIIYVKEKKALDRFKFLIWGIAAIIILLIGFSRIYLGVHFPTDVFGGWITAAIILLLFYLLYKPAAAFLAKAGKRFEFIFAAAAALLMNALLPGDTSLSGLLLGFCAGYSLMKMKFPFSAQAAINGKQPRPMILCIRFVLGAAGAAIIYIGLKFIFPGEGSLFEGPALEPYYQLGRFIRYGLLGLWASAGAPRLFINFNLAACEAGTAASEPEEK